MPTSSSLGFVEHRVPTRPTPPTLVREKIVQQQEEKEGRLPHWLCWARLLLSLGIIAAWTSSVVLIPATALHGFATYADDASNVLHAMWSRLVNHPTLTLALWLAPIPVAALLPLWVTEIPLAFVAPPLVTVQIFSLLSPVERARASDLLRHAPDMGYMWHETVLIFASTFLVRPFDFWLFVSPIVTVCNGPFEARRPWIWFVGLALASISTILPAVAPLINEDGEFFLHGYSTPSIFGSLLSTGFVLVWVRCYHLVSRGAVQLYRRGLVFYRVAGVAWALVGTAFVELWVSGAWALHFAIASAFLLEREEWPQCVNRASRCCRLHVNRLCRLLNTT